MTYCLYMCCHSSYGAVPPLFTPIQCGAALNPAIPGALRDDEGNNISSLNREYCELTAHYHAWKNVQADRYGFCHYRRFFAPEADTSRPYIVRGKLTERELTLLGNAEQLERLMAEYDIIIPRAENMGIPAGEHYRTSEYHFAEDLELFHRILRNSAPQLNHTVNEYLAQNRQYFCNMFIMDRIHFMEYCSLLFSALEEFDRCKTRHGCFQADRTDGYLGELFTGIYVNWAKSRGASVLELPRLDLDCSRKKRLLYAMLPPESDRRFAAKRFVKNIRRK